MRLIDADTLRAEFTGNFGRELWHYTGIWATIDVAPTIDAVPVVRCKDCKSHKPGTAMAFIRNGERIRLCHCDRLGRNVRDNDFCSYGERRANDAEN